MQTLGFPKVIEDLQERIHRIEGSAYRTPEEPGISTGFPGLDGLFAQRGLKRGTLIEWLGDGEGSGAATLALLVAAHLLRGEGIFVVIDHAGEFYPLAAASLGIPLDRTVVVRPDTKMAAWWAWEQSLRCPGVAVTFGWVDGINDRLFRRLQLGVEAGGGWGFLLRSPECRSASSWAATRISVKPLDQRTRTDSRDADAPPLIDALGWPLQVRLLRGLHGARETVIEVGPTDEASDVHLVSQLAHSTAVDRCAVV